MTDTFSDNQIKQLQEVISVVVAEKVSIQMEKVLDEKLAPLHENIDKVLKIVADDRDELDITKVRVSGLDVRVTALESSCVS